jgi:hypothetical protein
LAHAWQTLWKCCERTHEPPDWATAGCELDVGEAEPDEELLVEPDEPLEADGVEDPDEAEA